MAFDLTASLYGLIGGVLIGIASAVFLLMLGRVAGISGIAAAMLRGPGDSRFAVNLAFVAGLIGAPLIWSMAVAPVDVTMTDTTWRLIAGGLLVGIGTRIGSGCTSGHGVCGMSRFSVRSIAATLTFMAAAVLVASVLVPLAVGGQP